MTRNNRQHSEPGIGRRKWLKAAACAGGAILTGSVGACGAERPTGPPSNRKVTPKQAIDGKAPNNPAPPTKGPAPRPALQRSGLALGGGRGKDRVTGEMTYWLSVVDLDQRRQVASIPTHFFPHGVATHPLKPHIVLAFQKHGKGCCEIDLRQRRVTRKVSTVDGQKFYGHGAYSRDGRHFYCTETAVDRGYRGLLMVRDSKTHETLGEMPTGGKEPHDCVLINGGRTLVVTNGGGHVDNGGEGSVTYVDATTRQVQHTLEFTDPTINAGHLWVTSRGDLAIVSAPRTGLDLSAPKVHGALSFFSPGKDRQPRTVTDPIIEQMREETLSVAIHEPSMVVGATSPAGNLLTFWDFKTGKLLKTYRDLVGPRGIDLTLDGRHFAVTHAPTAKMLLVDVKTLEPVPQKAVAQSWITGSHIAVHHWT